jgi:hypothetical protein
VTGKHHGWTLVEVAVALVLGGFVLVFVSAGLNSQRRTAAALGAGMAVRAELRDATLLLAHELRGSARADTVALASDTAIASAFPLWTAVLCTESDGKRLLLTPLPLRAARRGPLVSAESGDIAWLWREDPIKPRGRWVAAGVASHTSTSSLECDPQLSRVGGPGELLVLSESMPPVAAGAPVQVVRRGRYSVYRATDGAWYLGYRRCPRDLPCQSVQPVAGPFSSRTAAGYGIEFQYFDSAGFSVVGAAAADRAWYVKTLVRAPVASTGAPPRPDAQVRWIGFRNVR